MEYTIDDRTKQVVQHTPQGLEAIGFHTFRAEDTGECWCATAGD